MSQNPPALLAFDPTNAALIAALATARASAGAAATGASGGRAVGLNLSATNPYAEQAAQLAGRQATGCWRFLHTQQQALSARGHHTSLRGMPHAAPIEAASMRFEWVPATNHLCPTPMHQCLYGLDLTVLTAGYVISRADGLGLEARSHLEFGEELLDQSLKDWFAQFTRLSRQSYARNFPISVTDFIPCFFSR